MTGHAEQENIMKEKGKIVLFIACSVIGAGVFFFFPDIDITLLGIRYHRFFLFHSAILPFAFFAIVTKIKWKYLRIPAYLILSGFTLGISVHLMTDVIPRKTVHFLLVSTLVRGTYLDDRLWIVINMILGFILLGVIFIKYRKGA